MNYSLKLFSKNLLLNLIIILEISCSAVFGMVSFGVFEKQYKLYFVTENLDGYYAYMPESENFYYNSSSIEKYVKSGDIILSRCRNEHIWGRNAEISHPQISYLKSEYKIDNVFSVNSSIKSVYVNQLKKGRWFSDEIQKDGVLECVIIGDVKKFPIGSFIDGGEFEIARDDTTGKFEFSLKNIYKFKIVGTLGKKCEVLDFMSTVFPAEDLSLSSMFKEISYEDEGFFEGLGEAKKQDDDERLSLSIICPSDGIYQGQLGDKDKDCEGANGVFTFKDGLKQDKKQEILSQLKKEGGVVSLDAVRKREKLFAKSIVSKYLPIMICFSAMSLVGVICCGILTMINNKHVFRIYALCGMNLKKGIKILAGYISIVMIISILLTLLMWALLSVMGILPWHNMIIATPSILFVIINFVAIFLVMMAICISVVKRYVKL